MRALASILRYPPRAAGALVVLLAASCSSFGSTPPVDDVTAADGGADAAADAGTAFNWFDAAVLTERAKDQAVAVTAAGDFDDTAPRDDAP